jgi:hypothetical protein
MQDIHSSGRNILPGRRHPSGVLLAWRLLWALPCTVIGMLSGLLVVLLGGSARRVDHTLEVALRVEQARVPAWAARWRHKAITLGHVIVGQSHEALAELRGHERVHVRQYEWLGACFFVAYPTASLIAWLRGAGAYHGNWFERQAVRMAGEYTQAHCRGSDAAHRSRGIKPT